jgi:UDP-GlcNAc:undecaprenyl-phosphate GlcNAc-1-phosphate transferase
LFLTSLLDSLWEATSAVATETLPWAEAIGAAAGVLLLAPGVRAAARRWGYVDAPSAARWHDRPVALMGGIAIAGALAGVLGVTGAVHAVPGPVWMGAALMFGIGLLDDLWAVQPTVKLLVQMAAAGCVLVAGQALWPAGPAWVSAPLTFLWVVGITNAFNLIDGLDGLAAGLVAIGAAGLGLLAGGGGDPATMGVAAAVAGAAAGFLVFNAPPARLFMGDCGSLVLGYLLAVLALAVPSDGTLTAFLAPVLMLAVPLADTALVTVTRLRDRRPVAEGGTDHLHHRLALLWRSEPRAVLGLHAAGLGAALLGLAAHDAGPGLLLGAAGGVVAAAGLAAWHLVRRTEPRVYRDRLRRARSNGTTGPAGAASSAANGTPPNGAPEADASPSTAGTPEDAPDRG